MKIKTINIILFFVLFFVFYFNKSYAAETQIAPSIQITALNKSTAIITLTDNDGIYSTKLKEKSGNTWKNKSISLMKIDNEKSSFKISKITNKKRHFKLTVSDNSSSHNKITENFYLYYNKTKKKLIINRSPRISIADTNSSTTANTVKNAISNNQKYSIETMSLKLDNNTFSGTTTINIKDNNGLKDVKIYDTSNKLVQEYKESQIKYIDSKKTTTSYTLEVNPNEKRVYNIEANDNTPHKVSEQIILFGAYYNELTIKKGSSKHLNIPDGTNFKSSNNTVATVDNTGLITAKQMGTTNITYTDISGNKHTYRVYVKIGNKKANISSLSKTSTDIIYKKNILLNKAETKNEKKVGSVLQFFDIVDNDVYYSSTDHKDVFINKNGSEKDKMTLVKFGHSQGFSIESSGNIWVNSISTKKGNYGYSSSAGISTFKYEKGKKYTSYGGTTYIYTKSNFKTDYNSDYSKLTVQPSANKKANIYTNLQPMIDETNGLFAVFASGTVVVFDLDTVKNTNTLTPHNVTISGFNIEKKYKNELINANVGFDKNCNTLTLNNVYDLSEITPLVKIPIYTNYSKKINPDLYQGYHNQGIDIDGDYIYFYQGNGVNTELTTNCGGNGKKSNNNLACVTAYSFKYGKYNGYKTTNLTKSVSSLKTGKALNAISNLKTKYAEPEGIKVKNGTIYLGVYSKNKKSKTANILEYK